MHKVNNPYNRSYKHHCFLPGGNNTSPSLMFLSLKLDIAGHEPTIMNKRSLLELLCTTWPKQQKVMENKQELLKNKI